jgi:hypothetical protein
MISMHVPTFSPFVPHLRLLQNSVLSECHISAVGSAGGRAGCASTSPWTAGTTSEEAPQPYSQNTKLKLRSVRHLCEDLLAFGS